MSTLPYAPLLPDELATRIDTEPRPVALPGPVPRAAGAAGGGCVVSGREWKPGDVAEVWLDGEIMRAVRTVDGLWHAAQRHGPVRDRDISSARPLVVIDPEDRDLARELAEVYDSVRETTRGTHVDHMQAALREFANPTPPKPEEPQGLGAVVEDDRGRRWTRAGDSHMHGNWLSLGSSAYTEWDEIKAVRVLGKGVTP